MFTLGIDFGTESVRAVLVDVANGAIAAVSIHAFRHGVIDDSLPDSAIVLPAEYALQHPADWLDSMTEVVREVMLKSAAAPDAVIGIGIDFTSCTILPTTFDGTPLCLREQWKIHPHAWPKLWKHHAAQSQANHVNALAAQRGEHWLPRYGGKISAEWVMPKALQILEEDAPVFQAAEVIVEAGDWIVWQLTGNLIRNSCAAGYKGTWHKTDGWVGQEFLAAVDSRFQNLFVEKFSGSIAPPGSRAGGLTGEWSTQLGLRANTPVAVAIIDAHAACIGGGVGNAGTMYMIMGTSTCHLVMSETEELVKGISGVVEDGIVAGLFGYEAGQASAGDALAWFVDNAVPLEYYAEADRRGISHHDVLSERASKLRPGESGLIALDWWNGCRSTLVDAELSGMILGLTLSTQPEEIYRAIIEATAFGTRTIIETFKNQHVPINNLVAGGGLTKNDLLMQIYADVCGMDISVAGGTDASAIGAAILGAVAAGGEEGGYATVNAACNLMAAKPSNSMRPIKSHASHYDALYKLYTELFHHFGEERRGFMSTLRALKTRGTNAH